MNISKADLISRFALFSFTVYTQLSCQGITWWHYTCKLFHFIWLELTVYSQRQESLLQVYISCHLYLDLTGRYYLTFFINNVLGLCILYDTHALFRNTHVELRSLFLNHVRFGARVATFSAVYSPKESRRP